MKTENDDYHQGWVEKVKKTQERFVKIVEKAGNNGRVEPVEVEPEPVEPESEPSPEEVDREFE